MWIQKNTSLIRCEKVWTNSLVNWNTNTRMWCNQQAWSSRHHQSHCNIQRWHKDWHTKPHQSPLQCTSKIQGRPEIHGFICPSQSKVTCLGDLEWLKLTLQWEQWSSLQPPTSQSWTQPFSIDNASIIFTRSHKHNTTTWLSTSCSSFELSHSSFCT